MVNDMRNQVSSNFNKRNDFRRSGKLRGHGGFTLAELLIVIAIIMILAAFGFVNVIENQRRLHLREMDDIARQIFIAAQNHLTVAEASGQWDYDELLKKHEERKKKDPPEYYLGEDNTNYSYYGLDADSNRYYYVTKNDLNYDTAIKYILPFGAIDETVRNGAGQYIILYDAKSATINGVFYTDSSEDELNIGAANKLYDKFIKGGDNNRRGRQTQISRKTVVGWYGPGEAEGPDENGLYRPVVTIDNEETLTLNIIDKNIDTDTVKYPAPGGTTNGSVTKIKILVKGLTSGALYQLPNIFSKHNYAKTDTKTDTNYQLNNSDYLNGNGISSAWSASLGVAERGKEGKKPAWIYQIYLDSVTTDGGHFADLFKQGDNKKEFIPGEDIEISVSIVYDNGGSSIESKAAVVKTNSLFGSLSSSGTDNTVTIANGRHLQNLSYDISHVGYISTKTDDDENNADLAINKASIIYGVSWKGDPKSEDFISKITDSHYYSVTKESSEVNVYNCSGSESPQGDNKFSAIRNKDLTEINGNMNELINFDIVGSPDGGTPSGSAGLIGKVESNNFTISNLIMINPEVSSTSDAGALIGTSDNNLTITSCAAYNATYHADEGSDNVDWNDFANSSQNLTISSTDGNVGGLVGSMTAGTITNSVASLYVNASGSTGNAGGLVGTCTGSVDVTDSYTGGHTAGSATSDIDLIGYYQAITTGTERGHYNVISAGGAAGGLIGSYADGNITNCYSTCSANGKSAAGGFIGNATGGTIKNTYCTGLVGGDGTKGAFIGLGTPTISTTENEQSYYFQIINNDIPALGSSANNITTVKAIDENLNSYNRFTDFTNSKNANAYDAGLARIYGENHYTLKTINSTGNDTSHALSGKAADGDPDWLTTHYGDWPAPETLVVNVPAP